MMHRMTRRSIDHGAVGNVLAIVDHDRPDLNEGEERNVRELVEWEEEWEEEEEKVKASRMTSVLQDLRESSAEICGRVLRLLNTSFPKL